MTDPRKRRPAARASAARDNVAHVEAYRPGSLERVRSLIPAESLAAIDNTSGISWLDVEHDHWLMDATVEVLGKQDAIDCWRQSVSQLVQKPLLRNFVDGSLRLFGNDPAKLIKFLPKGWALAYRDFCVPSFHSVEPVESVESVEPTGGGGGQAEIRFEDIAPQAFTSPGYLYCWHAVCLGVFDLAKAQDGVVDFQIQRESSRAVARFSWS